jgi:hypothetical protein
MACMLVLVGARTDVALRSWHEHGLHAAARPWCAAVGVCVCKEKEKIEKTCAAVCVAMLVSSVRQCVWQGFVFLSDKTCVVVIKREKSKH